MILLHDGGMLRGTISELVPNDYVVVVTATGEQRKLAMSEVKYAGPASGMPTSEKTEPNLEPKPEATSTTSQVKPFTTIHAAEARLKLTGTPGLTFHRRSGYATAVGPGGTAKAIGFDELCSTPCVVSIPAGNYVLGLSKDAKAPVASEHPVRIPAGHSVVAGTYQDKSGTRAAGWVVGGVGFGAGLLLMLTANEDVEECDESDCTTSSELDYTQFYLGVGAVAAGALLGWVLVGTPDSASFSVTPGTPASRLRPSTVIRDSMSLRDFGGFSATARF